MVSPNVSEDPRRPLAVLVGPTGVGKTAAALAVAERLPVEVVSCDSMAVYRGLDVGTSKPTRRERELVPHHLVDVAEPTERFDAGQFAELASRAIAEVRGRHRIPLIVGGTGFYLRALLQGLAPTPPVRPSVRAELLRELEVGGLQELLARLQVLDPALAAALAPGDTQRILRGLEVVLSSGRRLSDIQREHAFSSPSWPAVVVGLTVERSELYARIDARVAAMLNAGLVDEVRGLLQRGVPADARALQSPGYKEVLAHLEGHLPFAELSPAISQAHRRYAKRQLTWFRGQLVVEWMSPADIEAIAECVSVAQ